MNATICTRRTKHYKLCLSFLVMFFIFSYKQADAQAATFPSYLPDWFHNNFSTSTNGISSGVAIASYGDAIYVTGFFIGNDNNFCNTCFPLISCTTASCTPAYQDLDGFQNYKDAYLAKYCEADGALQWVKQIEGGSTNPGHVSGMDVTVDGSGNPIVTGYFQSASLFVDGSSVTLNSTTSTNINTAGDCDIFVMKFNSSGAYSNGVAIGSSTEDSVYSIIINSSDIYICGSYTGSLDLVGGSANPFLAYSNTGKEIFVIKIPSTFNSACGISSGGTGDDEAYDIASDASGNLFVTGYLSNTSADKDMFLSKISYSPPCSLSWGLTTIMGGTSDDYGKSLIVNSTEVYVTGNYQPPASINSIPIINATSGFGNSDVFISKYYVSNFNHGWTRSIGGPSNDKSAAVCFGSNGIIVSGNIDGSLTSFSSSSSSTQLFYSSSAFTMPVTCTGNFQPSSGTNAFIISYDIAGSASNMTPKIVFSSTANEFTINSLTAATFLYATGFYKGQFESHDFDTPCGSCINCSSILQNNAEFVSKLGVSQICINTTVITNPICFDCPSCGPYDILIGPLAPISICEGDQVHFQGSAIDLIGSWCNNNADYLWSFPGGTPSSSTLPNPMVVYNAAGTYSCSLTVSCSNVPGCDYLSTRSNHITVTNCGTPLPTPSLYLPTTTYVPASCAICPCTSCPPATMAIHITTYQDRDLPCDSCIQPFELTPDKKYMLSAWVKEKNPCILPVCHGAIIVAFPETTAPVQSYHPSGEIIDGWQRIEGVFLVPHDATSIQIFLTNSSANSADDIYFDDIRVHPFDANMKSYVYDPVSLRLVSELDENNYATFYEYDEEGKLARVKKETERGIATIKESRVNTKKN